MENNRSHGFDRFGPAVSAGCRTLGLAVTMLAASCAVPGASTADDAKGADVPSKPTATFPAKPDVAQLPSLPAPPEAFETSAMFVDEWGLLPTQKAHDDRELYDDDSSWGQLARTLATVHYNVRLSVALRCAALEMARFQVEKSATPSESLRRFMIARCGGTSPYASPYVFSLTAPETIGEQTLFQHAEPALESALTKSLAGTKHLALGVAESRRGARYAVVALVGGDDFGFDASAYSIDGSRHAVVRGSVRFPVDEAFALINRGAFGVGRCDLDPRVVLPAVSISCPLGSDDHSAWMQVIARRPGRLMSESVADILVDDDPGEGATYHARAHGSPALVESGDQFSRALLEGINRARIEGSLAPLALDVPQSAESARLGGTLMRAETDERGADVDQISLALLAGWNVAGTIRSGQLYIERVAPTRDANVWLDLALERPFGRFVLLDPDARRVAIGPAMPPAGAMGLGAVVTTYAMFDADPSEDDARRIGARVTASRAAVGLKPLEEFDPGPDLSQQAEHVLAGSIEPMAALRVANRALAQRMGCSVWGSVAEANDLDSLPIPHEILGAARSKLAIRVTHHRVRGAAWGQYVVFFVMLQEPAAPQFM